MPRLNFRSLMPNWRVDIFRSNATPILRESINSILVQYSDTKPPTAVVSVTSLWMIEDFFRGGTQVSIRMGWDRTNLAPMIFDVVTSEPDGTADEKLGYQIKITSRSVELARQERQGIVYWGKTKTQIIGEVASRNGYDADIKIGDSGTIPKEFIPKQGSASKGETDLELLYRMARNWDAIVWIDDTPDSKVIHFYDADIAHARGDKLRLPTIDDIVRVGPVKTGYELNYRTATGRNNIKQLTWKKKNSLKGDPSGKDPAVASITDLTSFDTLGEKNYTLEAEFDGERKTYELKKKFQNNASISTIAKMTKDIATSEIKNWINLYFVPVTGADTKVHEGDVRPRSDKRRGYEVTVQLNRGDPFLRPPRTGLLNAGGESGRDVEDDADLPGFLFQRGRDKKRVKPTEFKINKVDHSLVPGALQTKAVANR